MSLRLPTSPQILCRVPTCHLLGIQFLRLRDGDQPLSRRDVSARRTFHFELRLIEVDALSLQASPKGYIPVDGLVVLVDLMC